MEVVGRAEAFLVAEELDELGVELGGGAEEVAEVGLDDGAQAFGREVEPGEPAAAGEADAVGGIELDGQAVEGGGLDAEELVDFGDGALGRGEGQGAAEEEAFAAVIGHEDKGGVVFLIQLEAGEDPDGLFPAVKRPAEALEDQGEGIEGGGWGGLHGGNHRTTPRTKADLGSAGGRGQVEVGRLLQNATAQGSKGLGV